MKQPQIHPVVLTILDGWGLGEREPGNAIHLAKTPNMDTIQEVYPNTSLNASGIDVGLPKGQVGNSEVGHTSIGGGRIILQDLVKITASIDDNSFYNNTIINEVCKHVKQRQSQVHVIGLCSNGGVHSHISHLFALLDLLKKEEISKVCIHFIADGRDTKPKCAIEFLEQIHAHMKAINIGEICTISGRYYAMDRDCRWDRTEAFYKILTQRENIDKRDIYNIIEQFYQQDVSDEFIIPTRINNHTINNGDGIIFFNFRPDRMRQIVQAIYKDSFKGFERKKIDNLKICTFTQYDSTLDIPIAFRPTSKINFLGEIISKSNLKQFRIAETEKYAHVTYFFNGGLEEPFPGEDRELIPSPQVKTYDQSPDMSAVHITQSVISALKKQIYSLIVINYANPDMVGHTGHLNSTIKSIECVDRCIGNLLDTISKYNGTLIITADHGNAECMFNENGEACKSHTTNLVPFILIEGEGHKIKGHGGNVELKKQGSLADIAPTIIDILRISQPTEMTGTSLIENSKYEYRSKIIK
uniref:2,3-bisphosphoglycerate-independent phosphoglycerate mutase n=1 Tax=Liagoropsis maxima TaxID=1653392 RepID=A0A1G4NVM3_9FLOR|nr:Phosphoglycerate mutase [Liagoropsis maxima]SCW22728.1 Phosphoglycerate mutase [Liagoropsis maxima]